MTKEFGLVFVEVFKEISEVLHNHVGIVVRLKEPVIVLVMGLHCTFQHKILILYKAHLEFS